MKFFVEMLDIWDIFKENLQKCLEGILNIYYVFGGLKMSIFFIYNSDLIVNCNFN